MSRYTKNGLIISVLSLLVALFAYHKPIWGIYTNYISEKRVLSEIANDTGKAIKIIVGSYNDDKTKISELLYKRLYKTLTQYNEIIHLYYYPQLTIDDTGKCSSLIKEKKVGLILFGDFEQQVFSSDSSRINFSFLIDKGFEDEFIKSFDKETYTPVNSYNDITLHNISLNHYKYIINHILFIVFYFSFEYEKAIHHLIEINQITNSAKIKTYIADLCLKTGKLDSAEKFINDALSIDSNYYLVKENEMELWAHRGDWQKVKTLAERYVLKYPKRYNGYAWIGLAYDQLDIENSIFFSRKALELLKTSKKDDAVTTLYNNVSGYYLSQYYRTYDVKYIDSCITYADSAVNHSWDKYTLRLPSEKLALAYYALQDSINTYKYSKRCIFLKTENIDVKTVFLMSSIFTDRIEGIEGILNEVVNADIDMKMKNLILANYFVGRSKLSIKKNNFTEACLFKVLSDKYFQAILLLRPQNQLDNICPQIEINSSEYFKFNQLVQSLLEPKKPH